MNLLQKVTTGICALSLALGMAAASAQEVETGEASVEIISTTGTLAVQISDVDFGQHEYSFTDRTVPGTVEISATDSRGTAGGWTVSLSGTDFTGTAGTIGIGQLSLTDGSVTRSAGTGVVPAATAASPVSAAPGQVVLTANVGEGDGSFVNSRDASLTIPGGTRVGVYNSTLTVNIVAAP